MDKYAHILAAHAVTAPVGLINIHRHFSLLQMLKDSSSCTAVNSIFKIYFLNSRKCALQNPTVMYTE